MSSCGSARCARWIRQHEHRRAGQSLRLQPDTHGSPDAGSEQGTIEGHAHQGHYPRTISTDLSLEALPAIGVLTTLERVDARGCPRHQIRDAIAPFRQPVVVFECHRTVDEAGLVKKLPEPVGVAGEVMAHGRRPQAGVDADEQHAHAGLDSVAKRLLRGARSLAHSMSLSFRTIDAPAPLPCTQAQSGGSLGVPPRGYLD